MESWLRRRRDEEAYSESRSDLYGVAVSIVGDSASAEDLVQESWLRWNGRGYPAEGAPRILRRIIRNLARDLLRKRRREEEVVQSLADESCYAPDVESLVVDRDRLRRVERIVSALPARTRLAFRMSCVDGRTYAEISERLQVSRPRAHQLVGQALAKITMKLANEWHEGLTSAPRGRDRAEGRPDGEAGSN
ncbi:MAG: RNA polymerase sigma factor [Pseudomonadota bacterium]